MIVKDWKGMLTAGLRPRVKRMPRISVVAMTTTKR